MKMKKEGTEGGREEGMSRQRTKPAYKAGRVVVLDGARIAKRLQDRVGLQELTLKLTLI